MENVVAFNNELSGLYDTKPPISKAKMAAITKAAMRAIKFYKHVVQSVEKFILKCKPEYKVPGLYVIDSIVRQSRHQYGPEKDVFAPRFARNMKETFANLFRCASEDKSRIIRVLNLWQKNSVFAPEVIQPIFDLADPNHPIYQMPPSAGMQVGTGVSADNSNGANGIASAMDNNNSLNASTSNMNMSLLVDDKNGAPLPDLSKQSLSHDKSKSMENLEQCHKQRSNVSTKGMTNVCTTNKMRDQLNNYHSSHCCACDEVTGCADSICLLEKKKLFEACCSNYNKSPHDCCCHPHPHSHPHTHEHDAVADNKGAHNKNDDKDENKKKYTMDNKDTLPPTSSSNNLLDNNNLKQLLNDPNVLRQLQTLQNFTKFKQQEDNKHHKLSEMRMQEDAFEKHLQNVLKSSGGTNSQESNEYNAEVEFVSMEQNIEVINLDGNDSRSPSPERDRYKRRRSRSSSQRRDRRGNSRERRRRSRSRSTERSRSPRLNRRRNSRERDRERNSRDSRDTREKERDREHERERRKKGLPELKKEHLSVCSTTLWVGHLSKLVYQEELSDTFGEFGDIVSIDQIVPRGCAFIVMHRRQDAYKAMQNLKNHKLQGRAITISWAAGKGVKSKEWKDYWDLDLGVTYIPWNKLDENTDFDSMEEGGMFDEDSMPTWMKEKIQLVKSQRDKRNEPNNQTGNMPGGGNLLFGIDTTQPPPGPPSLMSMALPGQFPMAPPINAPPRPLLGPMGMPLQGLSMPPNLMTGMHPPHAMMMPPGMMPPGFPMPQSGPPPLNASPMGMPPPNAPPFAPAATAAIPTPAAPSIANNSSDDQMDIVMDDDESVAPAMQSQMNFNQPPPMFNNNNMNAMNTGGNNTESNGTAEIFSRDRNRSSSRWSGCNRVGEDADEGKDMWRENNAGNFNDNRLVGNNTHRPDFMNDNRNRAVVGAGSRGPDFFPNMPPNRFNQPTSLLQMRIAPPPNMFNPRMGGPKGGGPGPGPGGPMFMRGGPQGGGGRQPAPGFFNARNPFSDGGRGGMGRGGRIMDNRGNRGGRNSYGSNNWSDEEGDDNVFKRRGGNRFRDDDRNHRGSRPQGAGDWGHQRNDRRGGGEFGGNRRNSRNLNEEEKQNETNSPGAVDSKTQNNSCDTEDDWDRELEEYDARMENAEKNNENNMNVEKSQTIEHVEENANNDGIPESSTNDVTKDVMPIFDELPHSHVNDVVSHTSAKDFEEEIVQNQPINELELNSPPKLHDMIMEPEVTSAQVPVAVTVSENLELAQE